MNFVVLVSLFAALLASGSAVENGIRGRIFNGQNARWGRFKYMAVITATQSYFFGFLPYYSECGGTIIGPNWILTAAHCVEGASKVEVHLGVLFSNYAEVGYEIYKKDIIIHPRWHPSGQRNDIALIHTPRINECGLIGFAKLPFQWANRPVDDLAGRTVIAMGWGNINDRGDKPDELQWTRISVMSTEDCKTSLAYATSMDICGNTTVPRGSTCPGDSGGPLILEETGEVIGVASFLLTKSCEDGNSAIFMRVSHFLPWITEKTNIQS